MWILHILIHNIILVVTIEVTLGYILGSRKITDVMTVLLTNIITNPAVVLCGLCSALFFSKYNIMIIILLEIFAVFIEGFMFLKFQTFKGKNPYIISLILNSASYILGEITEKIL